jgi:hypothetical protein
MNKTFLIIGLSIIAIISLLIFGYSKQQEYDTSLKAKIIDREVRSYTITQKEITTNYVDESYGCILVSNDNYHLASLNYLPTIIAKGTGGKSGGGTKSTPKTTPKTTPTPTPKTSPKIIPVPIPINPTPTKPRSNNQQKNQDGTIDHDTDVAPDDNPLNPLKGKAPYRSKWRCNHRQVPRYTYFMRDNGDKYYNFATNQVNRDPVPEGWNDYEVGTPVARIVEYENYFLAGTDPIFSVAKNQSLSLQSKLIKEPETYSRMSNLIDQVYQTEQFYTPEDLKIMEKSLMAANSELNNKENKKQVNIQLFFIPEEDDDYIRQECIFREGCNKNDFILTIQLTKDKIVKRIQGYSWSQSAYPIALKLDSDYTATPTKIETVQDFTKFMDTLKELTKSKFERKEMSEFKYVKEELERQLKTKLNNN